MITVKLPAWAVQLAAIRHALTGRTLFKVVKLATTPSMWKATCPALETVGLHEQGISFTRKRAVANLTEAIRGMPVGDLLKKMK